MSCTNSPALLCSGCRSVSYCSAECQRADWPAHKLVCWRVDADTGAHFVHRSSVHLGASPAAATTTTAGWCPVDRATIATTTTTPERERCNKSTQLVCSVLDTKLAPVVPNVDQRDAVVRALSTVLIQGSQTRTAEDAELDTNEAKRRADSATVQPSSTVATIPASSSSAAAAQTTPMDTSPASSLSSSSSSSAAQRLGATLVDLPPEARQHIMRYLQPDTVLALYDVGSAVIREDLRDSTFWGASWDTYPALHFWYRAFSGVYRNGDAGKQAIVDIMLARFYQEPDGRPIPGPSIHVKQHAPHKADILDEALFYGRHGLWFTLTGEHTLPNRRPVFRVDDSSGHFSYVDVSAGNDVSNDEGVFEISPALPPKTTTLQIDGIEMWTKTLPLTLPRELERVMLSDVGLVHASDVDPQQRMPHTVHQLDLSYNELVEIPTPDKLPVALVHLNLSYNDDLSLAGQTLPPRLRVLDISGTSVTENDLNALPQGLTALTAIQLRVLSVFPDALPQTLQELDISSTDLSFGVDRVNSLTNLRKLNLAACTLRSVPNGVTALPALEWLNLANNDIKRPDGLVTLSAITWLDVSHNPLESLPTWPRDSPLKTLLAISIELRAISPGTLPPSLLALDVSYNRLTRIPEGLPNTLTRLNMTGNPVPVGLRFATKFHSDGTEMKIRWA